MARRNRSHLNRSRKGSKNNRRHENGLQKRANQLQRDDANRKRSNYGKTGRSSKKLFKRNRDGLIATAKNDITIPFYTNILQPQDPTLKEKGRAKGLALYDEVLQDGRCQSVLSKRISKLTRREWVVEPASEDEVDVRAADLVRDLLDKIDFDGICKRLQKAILKGYAVSEIVWHVNDDGHVAPEKIKDHDPARFRFDHEWNLRLLTRTNTTEGEELPDRKFIVHRYGDSDNNPYGRGLGSVLFWHVLFKREGAKYWLTHIEKFASPTPFAKYPGHLKPHEIDALLYLLRTMVQEGALAAPLGTEVEFLEAKRAGTAGQEEWLRYWDEQSSEVVMGSTLSTSVKGQGSRSATETHQEESETIIDDDADQLSETLKNTLIRWICDFNIPEAATPTVSRPRPKNKTQEEEQKRKTHERQQAALRTLKFLRDLGFEPKEIKQWLSDVMDVEIVEYVSKVLDQQQQQSFPFNQSLVKNNQGPKFADDEQGPIDHLIDQVEQLNADTINSWIDQIRDGLRDVRTFEEASQLLLESYNDFNVDPLGQILGDGILLAEANGRGDIIDETGIKPRAKRKKKVPRAQM